MVRTCLSRLSHLHEKSTTKFRDRFVDYQINYPITRLPNYQMHLSQSPSANLPLVFLLEDIRGMQIECAGGSLVAPAEFGVAAITDR